MRDTLAITAILFLCVVPVLMVRPLPGPVAPDQLAEFVTSVTWRHDADWFGGLSGIDISADGNRFVAVTDRGQLLAGTFERDGQQMVGATVVKNRTLPNDPRTPERFPFTDAEGVAWGRDGVIFVSFEHAQRVLQFDSWEAEAIWPHYTRAWNALGGNIGLEALAIGAAGDLITMPEGVLSGATEALVYRREPGQPWAQSLTLPLVDGFRPVGADYGPDGYLYLLEREARYGFRTQIRRFDVDRSGFDRWDVVLETPLMRHANLEGLAVWADSAGNIRLTMVSDNNFYPMVPTRLVEYVIPKGLEARAE